MPIPFEKKPRLFSRHPTGITLKDAISMYEWLLELGRIKKNGAAYSRLKQIRRMYDSGLRHFPKRKIKG
jgi:hypothetical protein